MIQFQTILHHSAAGESIMQEETTAKHIILGDLLSADRIVIFNGRRTKAEVLNALIDRIAREGEYGDRDDLEWAIFHRESLLSTGIGNGIATPHIILQNGEKTCMALGICRDGISDYDSLDSKPVRLVFMIIAGKDQKLTHLKVLAAIGSLFFDGRLKAAFLAANDPQTCLEILARAEK